MRHPDPAQIARLSEREAARFAEARPRSAALLARTRRSMARGVPMGWMTAIYQHPPMFAAARATLEEVLTPSAYGRANVLGAQLADGIEATYRAAGLDWRAQRLFCCAGFNYGPDLPRTAAAARAQAQPDVHQLLRLYMANRGVWESVITAGPTVSFAASADDVEFYLRTFLAFVGELMAGQI